MIENNSLFHDLRALRNARVLCIGDVMLDRFVYGGVDRISPEAPIPVLLVKHEKHMLGGAGNVVANIAALGAQATLLAVVGDDVQGREVQALLEKLGVAAHLEQEQGRATIVKSRFVSAGQQILRVDREKTAEIAEQTQERVVLRAQALMDGCGAVVLSDYKKGMLTDALVRRIIDMAQKKNVPVIVDPKGQDFARYRGAFVVTPNRKELEAATGMTADTDDAVRAASMKIMMDCGISSVLATRSQDGMSLLTQDAEPVHIPANVREVFDVSGAGDTVIATFSSAVAAGVTLRGAALLANVAAGIVVGKSGTATALPEEIESALDAGFAREKQDYRLATKCIGSQAAAERAEHWRTRGYKVGFTNGCFDLLHPGHLATLRQAKAACDYLIVAINSDAGVKRLKGPSRPVQDENARAAVLSAMEMVDAVVIFNEDTPLELLEAIRPDVLVKGGQYKLEEVVGYSLVMSYGGQIVRATMEDGFSTTNTISKMAQ